MCIATIITSPEALSYDEGVEPPSPCNPGAVVASHGERGPGHVFTEADWALSASEHFLPYHASKKMAEQAATARAAAQSRWKLVVILPGVVQGPPLGAPWNLPII